MSDTREMIISLHETRTWDRTMRLTVPKDMKVEDLNLPDLAGVSSGGAKGCYDPRVTVEEIIDDWKEYDQDVMGHGELMVVECLGVVHEHEHNREGEDG